MNESQLVLPGDDGMRPAALQYEQGSPWSTKDPKGHSTQDVLFVNEWSVPGGHSSHDKRPDVFV